MSDVSATPNGSTNVPPREPLLATKLYVPPVRANLVARPRLLERLDQGLSCRLILVSAPAGFGKTTLLSEWILDLGMRTAGGGASTSAKPEIRIPHSAFRIPESAWLSLDADDNDPVRFLTYLIAALQTIAPGTGTAAQDMLRSPGIHPDRAGQRTVFHLRRRRP